jgi:hypothetical protein
MKTLQTLEAILFNKIVEVAINCFIVYVLWFIFITLTKIKKKYKIKVYELIEQKKIEIKI